MLRLQLKRRRRRLSPVLELSQLNLCVEDDNQQRVRFMNKEAV
jgi:hypothetical protein